MKYVYVLFEKSTMDEGDCIRAISTRKDTIKKEFNRYKKEYSNYEEISEIELEENFVNIRYESGDFVSLEIQKHNII